MNKQNDVKADAGKDMPKVSEIVQQSSQLGDQQPLLLQLSTDEAEKVVMEIEKQITIRNKVWELCIRLTNESDWVLENGEPFLQLTGSSKLRERFGINIRMDDPIRQQINDAGGEYVMLTIKGTAEFRGRFIEDFGTCSSRDKFFGKDKDLEDVDLTKVIKKAATNLQNRLIKKVLGFFPEIADLEKQGLKLDRIQKVEYAAKGSAATDAEKKVQDEILKMLSEVYDGNATKMAEYLVKSTEFKGSDGKMVAGIGDVKYLRGKRLDIALGKIKRQYEEWKKTVAAADQKGDAQE